MNDKDTCGDSGCIDCNPNPAQLGESMTVQPGEWTPLDDHTEIWLYGEQAVTVVVRESEPDITFRETAGVVAVHVGEQRVTRIPAEAELALNALVDVLEALGLHPRRVMA